MFGMSLTEVGMIMVIVLVFLGPEKIPEAARFLGKMLREVRKASNLLRDAVAIDDDPIRPTPLAAANAGVAGSTAASSMRDPDPRFDMRMATMRPRQPVELESFDLAIAVPPLPLRENYLHVPYDETI